MSMDRHAFQVEVGATEARCRLAAEALRDDGARVLFGDALALSRHGHRIVCEVVESPGSVHRCAEEYAVLVENARRALAASRLQPLLPALPMTWVVVEDDGTGAVEERWTAP